LRSDGALSGTQRRTPCRERTPNLTRSLGARQEEISKKAYPLASDALDKASTASARSLSVLLCSRGAHSSLVHRVSQAILDLVNEAANHKQIKKGANEGDEAKYSLFFLFFFSLFSSCFSSQRPSV
jgi:hypothetical protein